MAKRFKDGVNSRADYFEKDVKAAQAAAKIVEKFNRTNPTRALHPPPPHTHTDYLSLSATFAQSIANLLAVTLPPRI